MPPPEDVTGVRKFLGFVGYYHKFIPRYSDVARLLTNLTRKDIPFRWTTLCQEAFEMLKGFLLEEPVLKYPNPDRPYVLYTDASKYAWAGVLTQAYRHTRGRGRKRNSPFRYLCQWTIQGATNQLGCLGQGSLCYLHGHQKAPLLHFKFRYHNSQRLHAVASVSAEKH